MPAALWYGNAILGQFSSTAARRVDWLTDTFKCALVVNTYTPNQDTHTFWSDVSANELGTGNGYTTGGVTLSTKTLTYDSASNTTRMDAADPAWTFVATKTFKYAVVYKDTGVGSTSPVLAYLDFAADQAINGAFSIVIDSTDGVLRGVVS